MKSNSFEAPFEIIISELEDNGSYIEQEGPDSYTVYFDDDPDPISGFTKGDIRRMHFGHFHKYK